MDVCKCACADLALTTDAVGESIEVEAYRCSSETLQGAQRCQSVHGSAGTGACCCTSCLTTRRTTTKHLKSSASELLNAPNLIYKRPRSLPQIATIMKE